VNAALKNATVVLIDQLSQEPYSSVLCFPKPSKAEVHSRIAELGLLGVSALEFSGRASVYGVPVPVLGKGFVGVVVIAHLNGERLAVKIRRLDADRVDLFHEAEMLKKANSVNAAPQLVAVSKNFLLMQLIEGDLLPAWLSQNKDTSVVKQVLRNVLANCCRLDEICLDHGELSKAPKHVIVDSALKPWIVDFETASDKRKPANLPAICHFLFNSPGETARTIAGIIGARDSSRIIQALHVYKRQRSDETFETVVEACLS
jgi:putative serine/threonine protein kinase